MNACYRLILPLLLAGLLLTACIPALEAPPTPEPVSLRFAFVGSELDYQALVEQFNEEYPWITIDLAGYNNFQRGLDPLLAEFQTADVVRINAAFLGEDQLAQVRPIDGLLAEDTGFDRKDVFPGLMEAGQIDGRQMALPAGIDPLVMFYENARFRAAGAAPPKSDYNLDGFLAAAQSVHNPDPSVRSEGKYSFGFCTTPFGNDPFTFVRLFGGDTFDRTTDPPAPTLNAQANVDAVRWYASLFTSYQVAPPLTENQYEIYSLMNSSACGFWIQFYDMLGFFENMAIDPKMLPLPATGMAGSKPWFALWDGYFLTQAALHPREAWLWMRFLAGSQAGSVKLIPPMLSQISSDEFAARVKPDRAEIARAMPREIDLYLLSESSAENEEQVNELFVEAVRRVIAGEADAQAALNEAQRQAEALTQVEMP